MAADAEKIVRANAPAVQQPVIEMPTEEVDGALAFLRTAADASIVEVDEKKLVRRIDWLIMTLLFGVYVLQYTDKSLSMFAPCPSVTPFLSYRKGPANQADSLCSQLCQRYGYQQGHTYDRRPVLLPGHFLLRYLRRLPACTRLPDAEIPHGTVSRCQRCPVGSYIGRYVVLMPDICMNVC